MQRPKWGWASRSWVLDAVASEFIGDCVVLAVDVSKDPLTAEGGKALGHVVTFREERAQMRAVATPDARHHHDDQHGVEFEDEHAPRVPESATEALTEAEKFGDIICARVWT